MTVLKHREVTEKIIRGFYDVYNELGPGYLESVYQTAMTIVLQDAGLDVRREVPVPVWFHGRRIGNFSADLIVNGVVIVELKVARTLDDSHSAQLLHYLKATDVEVGLLLNFGPQAEFKRMVFENSRKSAKSA